MRQSARLYDVILILSVLALWAAVQLPESVESVLGYFLILSIGVGHGANDLKIYFKDRKLGLGKSARFIGVYVAVVLAGFGAFFIIPKVTLVLFILVSGFHFGQEHFERFELRSSWLHSIFYTSYGTSVIIALLYFQSTTSIPILEELAQLRLNAWHLQFALYGSAATSVLLGVYLLKTLPLQSILKELFYFMVVLLIFKISSLVWGFAIYFILWHSLPSIHHQIHHLYGAVSKGTVLRYTKASALYWIAALAFLYLLYIVLNDRATLFLTIIVAFLGGITFPHVFVMHRIHED